MDKSVAYLSYANQYSYPGPVLFNVFMNDLFYFIKKCFLYNYVDHNFMSNASAKIDEVMLNLKRDSKLLSLGLLIMAWSPIRKSFN